MQQGKTPFLRLLLPLCAGIIASDICNFSWLPGIICLAVAGIAGSLSFFIKQYEKDIFFGIAVIFFFIGTGYILHYMGKEKLTPLNESDQIFKVRLSDYPEKKTNSYAFNATIEASGTDLSMHPSGSLLIYYISDSLTRAWIPGDRLLIKMTPVPIRNSGNPCEFNYSRYMQGRGTKYSGFIRPADILNYSSPAHRSLRELSAIAARKMVESFAKAGLKGDELGLVTAFTIGEKDLLDKEHQLSFSRAGVMHVMAVSGLHVGMISIFLSTLLFFMRRKWIVVRVMIILITLWAFAFITGLSPSVMRATIMFSFLQAATLIKRPGNSMNILLASAFILLVARPAMLFEAGFLLSYLAVGFIIAFYEPLYRLLKIKNKVIDYLWQMVAVSVVAQSGTFPLTVKLFNTFPVLFLVSNIVIIPLSFIIMILAFILIPFSGIEPVANILVWCLAFLSRFTLDFTSFVSSIPHGVISGIGMTTVECIILTIAITVLLISLLNVKRLSIRPFIVAMAVFFLAGWNKNATESKKEGIIIYNIKGEPLPAFISGGYLSVLIHSDEIPLEVTRHASTRGLKILPVKTDSSAIIAECGGYRLAYIPSGKVKKYDTSSAEMTVAPGTVFLKKNYFTSGRNSPMLVVSDIRPASLVKNSNIYIISDKGSISIMSEEKKINRKQVTKIILSGCSVLLFGSDDSFYLPLPCFTLKYEDSNSRSRRSGNPPCQDAFTG